MSFLDDMPYEELEQNSDLENVGKIAIQRSTNAVSNFERIRAELLSRNDQGDGSVVPPAYEELLMDDQHYQEIIDIYQIIQKYAEYGYESYSNEINNDVIKLAAMNIRLSTVLGYAKGSASNAGNNHRLMRSRYHIQIREVSEDLSIKMTDTAAENMARVETKEWQETEGYYTIINEMLSALYFSSMAFVRVLEGVAQRLHHERFTPQQG